MTHPSDIAAIAIEDADLPEYVARCFWCAGEGRYEQTYTAGCGMGYFSMMGACEKCGPGYGQRGSGLVFRATGKPVGASVIAQIQSQARRRYLSENPNA